MLTPGYHTFSLICWEEIILFLSFLCPYPALPSELHVSEKHTNSSHASFTAAGNKLQGQKWTLGYEGGNTVKCGFTFSTACGGFDWGLFVLGWVFCGVCGVFWWRIFFIWLVLGGGGWVVPPMKSWSLVQNMFPGNNNKRLLDASSPDWPEPENVVKITQSYSVPPVPGS